MIKIRSPFPSALIWDRIQLSLFRTRCRHVTSPELETARESGSPSPSRFAREKLDGSGTVTRVDGHEVGQAQHGALPESPPQQDGPAPWVYPCQPERIRGAKRRKASG